MSSGAVSSAVASAGTVAAASVTGVVATSVGPTVSGVVAASVTAPVSRVVSGSVAGSVSGIVSGSVTGCVSSELTREICRPCPPVAAENRNPLARFPAKLRLSSPFTAPYRIPAAGSAPKAPACIPLSWSVRVLSMSSQVSPI